MGVGRLALGLPTPAYGLLVKVGLTETLAFVSGFLFGSAMGFLSGAMIIIISDLFMMPGVWTPFIAAIIGIFGLAGSVARRLGSEPSVFTSCVFAVVFTVLSESLQNVWFAWFFNIPIAAVFLMGVPSTAAAIVNNAVLIPTVGRKVIRLIQNTIPGQPGGANARQAESSKAAQRVSH